MSSKRLRVGIVGASGYTGGELLRLLYAHPQVDVAVVTSRKLAGQRVDEYFPNLFSICPLRFADGDDKALLSCDVVFFATPHGVCMNSAQKLIDAGVRIIDFSGDFRLKDAASFEQWYGITHTAPALLQEAAYGLPEIYRDDIRHARLVANPGCYPTAVQLGFAPLLRAGLIAGSHLIADVKSGISGAGKVAKTANLLAEMDGNFKAYAMFGHRHQPEIEQSLSKIANQRMHCTFVPHLLPIIRGIEATLYAPLLNTENDIQALFEAFYQHEHFVRVLPQGSCPETRHVAGTNFVHIGIAKSVSQDTVIISVVEDNLVKGASGQAVQSMNIMFDLTEELGLTQVAVLP